VDAVAPRRLRGEAMQFEIHWEDFGGTPEGKDGEIRVRMGKSTSEPLHGRNAATGVFCRGYVENKGDVLAPHTGHVSNFCGLDQARSNRHKGFITQPYPRKPRQLYPGWVPSLDTSRTRCL
jgi:hypothetical protein